MRLYLQLVMICAAVALASADDVLARGPADELFDLKPAETAAVELSTGPYAVTKHGMAALPEESLTWRISTNKTTLKLSLVDAANNDFQPVVVSLRSAEAQRLLNTLSSVVNWKKKNPEASSQFAKASGLDLRDPVSGLKCALYTAPYKDAETGLVTIPQEGFEMRLYICYSGREDGKPPFVEDCVLLTIADGRFWPLVAKMDLKVATKLKDELAAAIKKIPS